MNLLTKRVTACCLLFLTLKGRGLSQAYRGTENTAPRAYVSESALTKMLFPLLYNILQDRKAGLELTENADLRRMAEDKWNSAKEAENKCDGDPSCVSGAMLLSESRVARINAVLHRHYPQSDGLKRFTAEKLVPKPVYSLDEDAADVDFFVSRLDHELRDINNIISLYCDEAPERYPLIDGMLYDKSTKDFHSITSAILEGLQLEDIDQAANTETHRNLFFEPSMRFAVRILLANMRDEAGRFPEQNKHENRPALISMKDAHWKRFHYSAIVVPGDGPNITGISLSPVGIERLRLAAYAWHAGTAPYVIVSGGYVHPSRTPYCEAVEMRRYLIEALSIPENAVLIEPVARHTTTNLRNVSRLIIENAMPLDRPMLVVSDSQQIDYIASEQFKVRNEEELGYQPVKIGKRISGTQLEATPLTVSLYRDAEDPLDP
jgi:hypothetical protein